MSVIFIYYTTDYIILKYILSNEKSKIEQGNSIIFLRYKLMLSKTKITTILQDLPLISWKWSDETNSRRKLSHLLYSWYQIFGDTIMYLWQRYLFFRMCNKDSPRAVWCQAVNKRGRYAAEL